MDGWIGVCSACLYLRMLSGMHASMFSRDLFYTQKSTLPKLYFPFDIRSIQFFGSNVDRNYANYYLLLRNVTYIFKKKVC